MTDPLSLSASLVAAYDKAAEHLRSHDSVLADVVDRHGRCTITPHDDYYGELIDSIVSQQLSVKAARTIEGRLKVLFGGDFPTPDQILVTDLEALRSAGLSRAKANYIKSLAEHIRNGELELEKMPRLSNAEIIGELTAVKGIGEWTAHMFLIFAMGRLDVLAVGDLGIRNGMQRLYQLDHVPTPAEVAGIADLNQWHPYESIACWYIWRSLDSIPLQPTAKSSKAAAETGALHS